MKITRRQLRRLVEVEVKLTDEEMNAARDELMQKGGTSDPGDFVQAVRMASADDTDEDLSDEELLKIVTDQVDDIAVHPMGDIIDTEKLNEGSWVGSRRKLLQIIQEEHARIVEGDVVGMFPPGQTAILQIARALASRAEEMLDLDGAGDDIEVRVEPNLFLTPYIDFDGHGQEVPSLANHVYTNYVSGKAGDQADSLDDILTRISIDYFDEPIEYALEALGDDRFTMPDTYHQGDKSQMMKTKELASQQDPEEVEKMGMDFERFLQGIDPEDLSEQHQPRNNKLNQVNILLDDALKLVGTNNKEASRKVRSASKIMDGEADEGAVEQVSRLGDKQTIVDMKRMVNSKGFSFAPD